MSIAPKRRKPFFPSRLSDANSLNLLGNGHSDACCGEDRPIKEEKVGFDELIFPLDRSIHDDCSAHEVIQLDFELDSTIKTEELGFAVLFIFSRMSGQTTLGVKLIKSDAVVAISATIQPKVTLAEAFNTCKILPAAESAEVSLEITEVPASNNTGASVISISQSSRCTLLTLSFNPSRISLISAQDFLEKIKGVLSALSHNPLLLCETLELITPTSGRLLPELSREIVVQRPEFVSESFFRVASEHPNQVAVSNGTQHYTYDQLSRSVRLLASQLLEVGLQPGEIVLISGISSFGMFASMLAVLAAGGVLVTLDQALPVERQNLIERICQPRHRIHVQSSNASKSAEGLRVDEWPVPAELNCLPNLSKPTNGFSDSAYIFFTSGSTGTPKGVLGTHLGLGHFLDWQRQTFPIGPGDRVAQIVALSFDPVLRDILLPLTSGACLYVPSREMLFDARQMLRWFAESNITLIHCVPSLMKAWLQADAGEHPFSSLRYILFAGEPLTDNLLNRFRSAASPTTQIFNLYGPTETTLAKLYNRIESIESGVQPIGFPQPGVDVAIFRERSIRCGLWEIGEIAIRTPYRSLGYHGAAALTAEVFRPNNETSDVNDLIYFTGDLGRVRSDGKVEIFGRVDTQIKIRGQRIEPNEVEDCLLSVDGVKDAAVTVRIGTNEEKVLLGLVVPSRAMSSAEASAFPRQIREKLKQKLADAMVPTRIVLRDSLPYLPNGKLDRKSISFLELQAQTDTASIRRDNTEIDPRMRRLVAAIEDALGIRITNLDLSFVDLGGDSLSFIGISLEIEQLLGWVPDNWEELSLSELNSLWTKRDNEKRLPQAQEFLMTAREAEMVGPETQRPAASGFWSFIETNVLLRALCIIIVVLDHIFELTGGFQIVSTTSLFFISGHSFGRFMVPQLWKTGSVSHVAKFILAFAVPAALYQLFRSIHFNTWWLPDLILLGTLWQSPEHPHFTYWYLDMLASNVAIMTGAILLWRHWKRPGTDVKLFMFVMGLFSLGLLLFALQKVAHVWDGTAGRSSVSPFLCFWIIALGWASAYASDIRKKLVITLVIFLIGLAGGSKINVLNDMFAAVTWFFYVSTLLALWLPRIPVPRIAKPAILTIATATLMIYITDPISRNVLVPMASIQDFWVLQAFLTVGFGVCAHYLWKIGYSKAMECARVCVSSLKDNARQMIRGGIINTRQS